MAKDADIVREAVFFESPAMLRAWFEQHHEQLTQAWIGFHKKASGLPSVTWPEAVDEALAFGWIDGVRQSIDAHRYRIRFTPRRAASVWSRVNVERFAALRDAGRIRPAGQRAFDTGKRRTEHYSYENEPRSFDPAELARFEALPEAWGWFGRQPPSYRKKIIWWIVSAKRPETREKRLLELIAACAEGRRLA